MQVFLRLSTALFLILSVLACAIWVLFPQQKQLFLIFGGAALFLRLLYYLVKLVHK